LHALYRRYSKQFCVFTQHIVTDHVRREDKAIGTVCVSVRPFNDPFVFTLTIEPIDL